MKRRELLALIGGAAALAPFGATAQPGLPVIGYLSSRSAEAETPLRTAFLEGLEQRGFVVGRNVAIEYRYAEGSADRLPSLAAELTYCTPPDNYARRSENLRARTSSAAFLVVRWPSFVSAAHRMAEMASV